VLDGHISPLNLGEVESSLIYVYNGIFLSRAVDTKDTFRVCVGEEACRKAAGQDLINQKHLLTLSIDGLHTVLTTIIDLHGERFVAQSIIPGVLSTGVDNSARLVYGVLQPNHRISNKISIQPLLESMKKALRLRACSVSIIARIEGSSENDVDATDDQLKEVLESQANDGFLSQIESDYKNHSPIRVDEEDEVVVIASDADAAATTMAHIGPIEGKLLQGSDARVYALDFLRLTPRDANYVIQVTLLAHSRSKQLT
jgi:protein TIF31